jgi:hypothetical protein
MIIFSMLAHVHHWLYDFEGIGLVIALHSQTPKDIRGGWSQIWSLSNPGSNQQPVDHWRTSLPTALTGPTRGECEENSWKSERKKGTSDME